MYERDIICLPSWFNEDGLIQIPRRKIIKEYLAVNKLVGKIRLDSLMSEEEIFDEIRSMYKAFQWFNEDGLIQIPRWKIIKEYLAVNKLVGKEMNGLNAIRIRAAPTQK